MVAPEVVRTRVVRSHAILNSILTCSVVPGRYIPVMRTIGVRGKKRRMLHAPLQVVMHAL